MRRSEKYFEKRVARLARNIKMLDTARLVLDCQNPGDGKRYQIIVQEKFAGREINCFPRQGHIPTNEFDWYLTGLLDAIEEGLETK